MRELVPSRSRPSKRLLGRAVWELAQALPWLGLLAVTSLGMRFGRAWLDTAHVALVYVMLVLVVSSRAGSGPGLGVAVTAFFAFNFIFVPPFGTLSVAAPLDWLVLLAFLATSTLGARLLARARSEAEQARARAAEVGYLSGLGAQALSAGRAEDALAAIVGAIQSTLGVDRSEIFLRDPTSDEMRLAAASGDDALVLEEHPAVGDSTAAADVPIGFPGGLRLVEWVATSGRAVLERADGAFRVERVADGAPQLALAPWEYALDRNDARALLLPLQVGARVAGVLRVAAARRLRLDAAQRRYLEALLYYAALGADRVRLVADADAAQALRAADALKNALLASVSHDLRTPLTTIKAVAHSMRVEGDERAATIEQEADRLNHMVRQLLDYSRVTGGALVVTPELNAVDDLVGAALQQAGGALGTRSVQVSLGPDSALLAGRFDIVHASRILVNLLENAAKYSPADGALELTVRRVDDWLEVVLADRGPGVPEGERERIFQPFYRAPRPQVPAGRSGVTARPMDVGSAGLGLAISRELAEAQQGDLHHEPRPGGGSRFVLRLPAASLDEAAAEQSS